MEASSLNLLRELSDSFGPSGFERETAGIVKREAQKYADEITFDKLGSVIARKRGTADTPKILLAGHMDARARARDASMIPNQAFKQFVIDTAEKEGIPYQLSVVAAGGTDAGKFHVVKAGAPAIVISVPTRHIHSHAGIADLSDIDNAAKLVLALIRKLDGATVKGFTQV